jgi:signal peptidase I
MKRRRGGIFPQWFFSRAVRHTNAMCKHVRKLLNHQRDVLDQKAIAEVESVVLEAESCITGKADRPALEKQMEKLEKAANKWLKPYPNAAWRENVEVLLVALAVAMAIRTFFLQPFKIPTGSMQPTLYGVTSKNLDQDFKIPTGLQRLKEWFQGTSYIHITAEEDGEFEGVEAPVRLAIFNIYQKIHFAGKTEWILFPPDYGSQNLAPSYKSFSLREPPSRADVHRGQLFKKGEDIIKLKVNAGDHLFVDRVSYNFRPPERGEIIVFETHGIERLVSMSPDQQDTFYIKRLVGLSGETLSIQQDYEVVAVPGYQSVPVGHLVVNGRPISASDRHFENLYSFNGAKPDAKVLTYEEDRYFGHGMIGELGPGREFQVGTNRFFVMGDNTMNSSDSRFWGDFSQKQVIGKSFFVYWPVTDRFGWSGSR